MPKTITGIEIRKLKDFKHILSSGGVYFNEFLKYEYLEDLKMFLLKLSFELFVTEILSGQQIFVNTGCTVTKTIHNPCHNLNYTESSHISLNTYMKFRDLSPNNPTLHSKVTIS